MSAVMLRQIPVSPAWPPAKRGAIQDGHPYEASYRRAMAIFVTDDDAQGGRDHIDAHRTVFMGIGPYFKRNYVSHVNTSFPGMLKSIIRLLGLPPLSLFDAVASDLSDCFTNTPDYDGYQVRREDSRIAAGSAAEREDGRSGGAVGEATRRHAVRAITLLQFHCEDVMRHFDQRLDDLQIRLLEMGGRVELAIQNSVGALVDRDEVRARQVVASESDIDALDIEIDDLAVGLMALNQPVARDMRFLAAAIKINSDLERMGDLAAHIAERALSLMQQPPVPLLDIPRLAQLAWTMAHDSLDALVRKDAELAQRILLSGDAIDRLREGLFAGLVGSMESDAAAVPSVIHLLFVVRYLERIADHATNIGEDVLYYLQGVDVRHRASLAR